MNNSDKEIVAGDLYGYCAIYEIEEFLLVYKWATNDHIDQESWIPVGKAYVSPIYCPMPFIPVDIPAQGEFEVAGASWSQNPDNIPFVPGRYYTALSYTLEIKGKTKNLDLKLEFEVR